MDDVLSSVLPTLGGIAWDPHLRGIFTVLVGVVVLMGSVYLILFTNIGARLGFLLAVGAFFGWMTILGVTWWLQPPAIGPRGNQPIWEPVEIVYGDPAAAETDEVRDLPNTCWSTRSRDCELPQDGLWADQLIAENPEVFADFADGGGTLTEIETVDDVGAIEQVDTAEWEVVNAAEAGEAVSEADIILQESGVFAAPTEYKVLDTFEVGGKDGLPDDPSRWDRISTWIESSLTLQHPTHYAIVQVQPVVPQTPEPGEPPPTPIVDESAPVISVVMVRELGNTRVPAALVTVGSGLMLAVCAYALHRRDQLVAEHVEGATATDRG